MLMENLRPHSKIGRDAFHARHQKGNAISGDLIIATSSFLGNMHTHNNTQFQTDLTDTKRILELDEPTA